MNFLRTIIAAPVRLVSEVARTVNIVTEKVIGTDLDILDVEGNAKDLADTIEDED